jgi:transcriptional regulator with XRE-family HTH domain
MGGIDMARKFSGALLQRRRKAAGLKPEQLALRVDRSVFAVHQWERGTSSPRAAVLAALADTLDCTVEDFFVRDGESDISNLNRAVTT